MAPTPPRFESIEIPERPSVASERMTAGGKPRRVLLWGCIAAAALVVLAAIGLQWSGGGEKTARAPAEAPLIKAEEQPIKVSPERPGGMEVPNRDIMVYGRIHGAPGGKAPVERLLPEPEQPLTPPAPQVAEQPPVKAAPGEMGVPTEPIPEPAGRTVPPPPDPVPPVPVPAPAPVPTPAPMPKPPAAAPAVPPKPAKPPELPKAETPKAAAGGRYQVQLFAGRSADEANAAWRKLKAKNPDVLGPLSPALARADLGDRGTFYRLRAGPIESEAKAKSLCSSLAGRGAPCIIIRPGN